MEIIKIMNAVLAPCQTDGEYQWAESSECAYGRSWEGDVRATSRMPYWRATIPKKSPQ